MKYLILIVPFYLSLFNFAAADVPSLIDSFDFGDTTDDPVLPVEKAYQFNAEVKDAQHINLNWRIADKTYLYYDKVKVEILNNKEIQIADYQLPKPVIKKNTVRPDGEMGDIEVYKHELDFDLPLKRSKEASTEIELKISYQGCAERGICYPPVRKTIKVSLPAFIATSGVPISSSPEITKLDEQGLLHLLKTEGKLWSLLILYGLGILLAFTPCVFPMIPILAGIIAGQGDKITTKKAFYLSFIYVLFMALTYAVVGVIAGSSGANLQATFQNPFIISIFVLIFIALAFAMFDFYSLQLPASWQSKLNNLSNSQKGGNYLGVAVMGVLSALIVGPCITAPLLAILIYIAQEGEAFFGGVALFALGLGMGTPLLLIGTSAGKILPRAGAWMDAVKAGFGVMMLALAIYMLERIVPAAVALFLWAMLLIVSGVYLGALEPINKTASGWFKLWKGLGVVILIYGILMLIGVAMDSKNMRQPLRNVFQTSNYNSVNASSSAIEFKQIKTIEDLDKAIKEANQQGKNVMLDFYADWCVYCKQFENYTFFEPIMGKAYQQANLVLLQADVTKNDEFDIALQAHLEIPAPPAILFFGLDGQEKRKQRVFKFMEADEFALYIKQVFL